MPRLAVLNVVGLSTSALAQMPKTQAWAERAGHELATFKPAFPAVTCTAQSTYLTGLPPAEHGIVGNGWYDRTEALVKFWKQSNKWVEGPRLWEEAQVSCAKMFWWYNMYSTADFSATPRPLYPADGRKVFDIHTQPMGMREELKEDLGDFPFPAFWGPRAGIESSEWIAQSARWIEEREQPELNLVYLPHLDYGLQKLGPNHPDMAPEFDKIDALVTETIAFFEKRDVEVTVISEYGISPVDSAVHPNRIFREKGWIQVKDELGRETLDCGSCRVFAVADHQVAHVYLSDSADKIEVRSLLEDTPGVAEVRDGSNVWGTEGSAAERGGDLVAIAEPNAWFTYYYWLDDAKAPDFARSIDIHRKPGYDPAELFIDPKIKFPTAKVASFLAKKKLGFRALIEVIPLDATLVKGSHGRDEVPKGEQPVAIGKDAGSVQKAEDVFTWLKLRCSQG